MMCCHLCSSVDSSEELTRVMLRGAKKDDSKLQSTECTTSTRIIAQTSATLSIITIVYLYAYNLLE